MQNDMGVERVSELLMQRTTGALSAPEAEALSQALATLQPGEVARWESAAAELSAAFAATLPAEGEQMPASLSAQIISHGEATVRAQPRASTPVATRPIAAAVPRVNGWAWAGWMAAAAALALWAVAPRAATPLPEVNVVVRGAAALRDSLLARDSSVQRIAWTATADSAARGASGDVVWSTRAQSGVMRFAGLQPNDRTRWQYQLWIFDKNRNEKYPVDGGVFDVPPGASDVLVTIDPRVPVGDAVMFAITVEPAGGVVVSSRERIALLAQRGS